jgi:hypothetical protein
VVENQTDDKNDFISLSICHIGIYLEPPDLNLAKMAFVFAQKSVFGEALPKLETTSKTAKYVDNFTEKSRFFLFIWHLGIYLKRIDLNLAGMASVFAQKSVFGVVPPNLETTPKMAKYLDDFTDKSRFFIFMSSRDLSQVNRFEFG